MPYDIAEKKVLEKIEAICQALDIHGYRQLLACVVPDENDRTTLIEKMRTWYNGRVRAMQDLRFFELLRDALVRKQGQQARMLFKEEVTALELLDASVEEFVEHLAEPFLATYRRRRPAPGGSTGEAPADVLESGLMVGWNQLERVLDRVRPVADGAPGELRLMMTVAAAWAAPRALLRDLAAQGVSIRIILEHPTERQAAHDERLQDILTDLRLHSLPSDSGISVQLAEAVDHSFLAPG